MNNNNNNNNAKTGNEEVRVCIKCFNEINEEYVYITNTLPLLKRGETFRIKSLLGLTSKYISLRLLSDCKSLIYEEDGASDSVNIQISSIESIQPTSFIAFEIRTTTGNKIISYSFEAVDRQIQLIWIASLNELIKYYHKQLNFSKNNELLRKQKKEEMTKQLQKEKSATENESQSTEEIEIEAKPDKREQRKIERQRIRDKYGIHTTP